MYSCDGGLQGFLGGSYLLGIHDAVVSFGVTNVDQGHIVPSQPVEVEFGKAETDGQCLAFGQIQVDAVGCCVGAIRNIGQTQVNHLVVGIELCAGGLFDNGEVGSLVYDVEVSGQTIVTRGQTTDWLMSPVPAMLPLLVLAHCSTKLAIDISIPSSLMRVVG